MILGPNSLSKKLWMTVFASIFITIAFSFLLSNFFYEKLYVEKTENTLLDEGKRIAHNYQGGPLTKDLKEKVEWYNSISDTEIFMVNNPKELSACLPFDIDYQSLIKPEEREQLLDGESIIKTGYEKRFDRKIVATIIPLLDENRLEGIIYLYLPLEKISEVTKDFSILWLAAAVLFLVISLFFGTKLIHKLTRPLKQMTIAAQKVSEGNYNTRVDIDSKDEIGQLGAAFNQMSASIQKEDERKKEFLANVSHELRTPISYVKGYSEALTSGMIKEDDFQRYLRLIHREAGRMERLVGDIFDLTKMESDEFKLIFFPLVLSQLIEDAVEKYTLVMKEKGLSLTLELDPDIIINGDEGRLEQVLQNLMDNSIRYTKTGGITISLNKHPKGCIIELMDTGCGIPKEDLQKLTQRFYRVNKGRTRVDGGTGLGLAITEKIILLHGGDLEIESELGKGTCVKIILPTID
ncbi:sensor histidine kinase [Bacillus massilinigeriensis]|uniref:sensor histidine kinase n=1 Tax=Bacillus massilionigeriensis TaxID=1805475 RepID=UPI00096AFB75|nr:ATP-binding protein [Bacillus massilionigeriensis]